MNTPIAGPRSSNLTVAFVLCVPFVLSCASERILSSAAAERGRPSAIARDATASELEAGMLRASRSGGMVALNDASHRPSLVVRTAFPTKVSFEELSESEGSPEFCSLGADACGWSSVYINSSTDRADVSAGTYTNNGKIGQLAMGGAFVLFVGFSLPQKELIGCETRGTACQSGAMLTTNCLDYTNYAKFFGTHGAAFANGKLYTGTTSQSDTCNTGGPGGGDGGGGTICTTEQFWLDVWDDYTGMWVTVYTWFVTICDD